MVWRVPSEPSPLLNAAWTVLLRLAFCCEASCAVAPLVTTPASSCAWSGLTAMVALPLACTLGTAVCAAIAQQQSIKSSNDKFIRYMPQLYRLPPGTGNGFHQPQRCLTFARPWRSSLAPARRRRLPSRRYSAPRPHRHAIAARGASEFVVLVHDGLHQGFGGLRLIDAQCVDQPVLAVFVAAIGAGFRDAIGVQQQRVAGVQSDGGFTATPVLKGAQHGGGGVEDFDFARGAQQ